MGISIMVELKLLLKNYENEYKILRGITLNKFSNPTEIELKDETVIAINKITKATTGGRRMDVTVLFVLVTIMGTLV